MMEFVFENSPAFTLRIDMGKQYKKETTTLPRRISPEGKGGGERRRRKPDNLYPWVKLVPEV